MIKKIIDNKEYWVDGSNNPKNKEDDVKMTNLKTDRHQAQPDPLYLQLYNMHKNLI